MSFENALRVQGYAVASSRGREYSFDLVVARFHERFAIKIAEGATEEQVRVCARDLQRLAHSLDVTSLMLCKEEVPEGILVMHKGVVMLNTKTFEEVVKERRTPFIYFDRGGVYVRIRGEVVREHRRRNRASLGDLSMKLGVTRRMVYEYESGGSDATINVANKLVDLFGEEVLEPLSLEAIHKHFSSWRYERGYSVRTGRIADSTLRLFSNKLEELGFSSHALKRAPFQVAAREKGGGPKKLLIRKDGTEDEESALTAEVAQICESHAILLEEGRIRLLRRVEEASEMQEQEEYELESLDSLKDLIAKLKR